MHWFLMKSHSVCLLEHNALFRNDMTDWEFQVWLYDHEQLLNEKSLIGL